jgi:hypothetical protein
MDDGQAFELIGKTASLIIAGRRIGVVMVPRYQASTRGPCCIDLPLPTPIGELAERIRVRVDQVEPAP